MTVVLKRKISAEELFSWLWLGNVKFEIHLPLVNSVTVIFIPNRSFLVRFNSISGEFGRAMVRILARRTRTKIPIERPNEVLEAIINQNKQNYLKYYERRFKIVSREFIIQIFFCLIVHL